MATSDGKKTGGRISGNIENSLSNGKDISDRLIESHYLHSSTANFLTSVNRQLQTMTRLDSDGKTNGELLLAIQRMTDMAMTMNDKVNEFYKDIGLTKQDILRPGGKNEYGTVYYQPAGATEFSTKFLGLRRHIKGKDGKRSKENRLTKASEKIKMTPQSVIYETIRSLEAAEQIRTLYEKNKDKIDEGVFYIDLNDKEMQSILNSYYNLVGEKLVKTSGSIIGYELQEKINKLFKFSKNNSLIFQSNLTGRSFINEIKNLGSILEVNEIKDIKSKTNAKMATLLKSKLERKLTSSGIFYSIGKDFYNWVEGKIKMQVGEDAFKSDFSFAFSPQKKEYFANQFTKMVVAKKGIYFTNNNHAGMVGFLGELSAIISFNAFCEIGCEIAVDIGQTNVIRKYTNVQYSGLSAYNKNAKDENDVYDKNKNMITSNTNDNDLDMNYIFKGESGSDMTLRGQSGKIYKIQIKNSFSENDWHSIRLKSKIKLSTFVPTAFRNDQNLIIYLLSNWGYLNKYGKKSYRLYERDETGRRIPGSPRGYYDQGEDKLTTGRPHTKRIISFINFFIQQAYAFLLSVETMEVDSKNYDYYETVGNIGFIIRGQYFVPIAAFLVSSLELLKNLVGKKDLKTLHGAGGTKGLTMSALKTNDTLVDSTQIQRNKYEVLEEIGNKYGSSGEEYPTRLLAYGSANGDQLYNQMSLNSIVFATNIKSLEKMILKRYGKT